MLLLREAMGLSVIACKLTDCLSRPALARLTFAYLVLTPLTSTWDIACVALHQQTGRTILIALQISLGFVYLASPIPAPQRQTLVIVHAGVIAVTDALAYTAFTALGPDTAPADRLLLFHMLPHAPAWGIDKRAIAAALSALAAQEQQVCSALQHSCQHSCQHERMRPWGRTCTRVRPRAVQK